MRTSTWWTIIIVLLVIIAALAWFLFATPAPVTDTNVNTGEIASTTSATTTATATATTTAVAPTVSSPASGATVPKTFVVKGDAPGNWYVEAVFPIEVRDGNGTVVGHGQAHAESDWMTTAMVPFTATTTVQGFTGTATLVLKRDNPSGDPVRDASVSIPIVIK